MAISSAKKIAAAFVGPGSRVQVHFPGVSGIIPGYTTEDIR